MSAPPRRTCGLRAFACLLGVALLCAIAASPLHAQQKNTEPFLGLDAYITRAMSTWKVPGLALAIVRNDSVLYVKGYGVRSIAGKELVDARTLFAIGSNSKSFTAAVIAMLVTDGKMRYDDPVTSYLPWFQLYDPWVTREVTIRDVLTHRIGLGRQEAIWYGTGLSRDEILRRVRYLKPAFSFRSRFGYSNMMYLAAGQAAAAAAHASWDDLIRDRIFVPLEMTSSNTSVRARRAGRRCDAARNRARHALRAALPEHRRHRSCGRDQLERDRYGPVAPLPAR